MNLRESANAYIYIIDEADRIVSVSDNWLLFAQENDALESCHPDAIINKSIWDYISGIETQHLFKLTLERVRKIGKTVVLPFRCDSPEKRRFLELLITPVHQKNIEFTSYIVREESRDTVDLLNIDIPRSGEIVKLCSMCKKIELSGGKWVEIEDAIDTLKIFEQIKLPQISHGLCADCFESAMKELEREGLVHPHKSLEMTITSSR